jgi:hypothetical protein
MPRLRHQRRLAQQLRTLATLLVSPDVLVQRRSHSFLLGLVTADGSRLVDEAIVNRKVGRLC